ncbi:uncharacterized protein METZ01_LOCUS416171, partial [marine metagenome]
MSVFGMYVKVQALDEGLNRLVKWKVEVTLVVALVLLAWVDSVQALGSLSFVLDHL